MLQIIIDISSAVRDTCKKNMRSIDTSIKVLFLITAIPIIIKMFGVSLGYDINFGWLDNWITLTFGATITWVSSWYLDKD